MRCHECKNCLDLEKVRASVFKVANPPFSHACQDVIDLWNTELQRLPCLVLAVDCHTCHADPGVPCRWGERFHPTRVVHARVLAES